MGKKTGDEGNTGQKEDRLNFISCCITDVCMGLDLIHKKGYLGVAEFLMGHYYTNRIQGSGGDFYKPVLDLYCPHTGNINTAPHINRGRYE